MAVNITELMTRLGHAFFIGEANNATLGGTVPTRVDAFLTGLGAVLGAQYEDVRSTILDGQNALQQSGAAGNSELIAQPAQELILQTVMADKPGASTLDLAVRELIKQFEDTAQSFEASVVGSTLAYDVGNIGNGVGLVSTKRPDGKVLLFAYAEDLVMVVTNISDEGIASFTIFGVPRVEDLMPTWPKGSGSNLQTLARTASSASNLIGNGTFETNDEESVHLPLGWIASVGQLGATIKMGSVEQQTISISGGPTAGFYVLQWSNNSAQVQTTIPIDFEASGAAVQDALQGLVGLEGVEVSSTGAAPNYVHTVTFNGVPNPSQLTSISSMTGGAIAHATTVAASAHVMRGARALEIDFDGFQLPTLNYRVILTPSTQYAFNVFVKADVVPAAGAITFDLVNGIGTGGGTVLNDGAGTANAFTITAASLTTSFVAKTGIFRTPAVMPPQVYLRIRVSTAISATSSVYFDEAYLGLMDSCYPGGPEVAVFAGSTAFQLKDRIVATITNNRAGLLHEWMNRVLGLRDSGLIFPTSGSPTQPDSLVA